MTSAGFLRYIRRMAKRLVKLSIKLPPEIAAVLRTLSEKQSTTMTEVIRKGISLQESLSTLTDKGEKILIEDRKGRLRQLVL